MKYINVIDLDNTLLPYDSFKKYILLFIFKKNTFLKIIIILFIRSVRLINSSKFKRLIFSITAEEKSYDENINLFADKLILDFREDILLKIDSYSNELTLNVLVTASYQSYAKKLANSLYWECIASHVDQDRNNFVHVYGNKKIELVKKHYPSKNYIYNYAISDSKSDYALLKMFMYSDLIK